MTNRRTGWNGIVALLCVASCLVVKVSGASDAKREKDGDELTSLRKAVLARFDFNQNGRLDSKEKAKAYRELLSKDNSDEELNGLRERLLSRFDKNANGKLERSEIRAALIAVNSRAKPALDEQSSTVVASTENRLNAKQMAAAVASDPSAAVAFTAQQLTTNGYDTATAEALAIQKYDLNGDGVLDASEMALAQAQILRQLASLSTTGSTITTPIVLATGTGTSTTGTTSTGSTTSGSSSGSMAGGCSASGSSGTSGTSGSGTSTGSGTTNSAAARFNNGTFSPAFASPSIGNFGAGSGGNGGRRGR
jgi:Ca2+-binding EF-hand superfamily protein